jgi:murein DD-endopeptidase MepM/ murein hydrolase activator NlpD
MSAMADNAHLQAQHLALEYRLIQDRNHRIFSQLEEAVEEAMSPLERMFRDAGLPPERILQQVRSGLSDALGLADADLDLVLGHAGPRKRRGARQFRAFRAGRDQHSSASPRSAPRSPCRFGRMCAMTSGFGTRRDPRRVAGACTTASTGPVRKGTPILSTGAGRVKFAGRRAATATW